MSDNLASRLSYPEYMSDILEPSPIKNDWPISGYTQPSLFGSSANPDPIPGACEDSPAPNPGDWSVNSKVAIPRTSRPENWTRSSRVNRACQKCREQKAKCSGHHPSCHRCQAASVPCSYGDRKRERILKQLENLTEQVRTYEALLRDLYPRLDPSSAQRVDQTLGGGGQLSPSRSHPDPASIGYPFLTIDHTKEDFNRDEKIQAMGFVGEHSEMAWLYKLKRDLDYDSWTPVSEHPDRSSISSLNYFQDDIEISGLDNVELLARPPQNVADKLVDDYFEFVHPEFPVIGRGAFLGQYRLFYTNPNVRPGRRWMAVLNLVFAIAVRHSLLMESHTSGACDDHWVYFARAWRLSMGNVCLLGHPNLQQVQVEGLTSFYLLSTGQVNRSWRIIGIAIRSALAMGLNLRSQTESVAHLSKETRYRVWWALFMLDTLLCVITGRPPSTAEIFCSTPLPIPYREEDWGVESVAQFMIDKVIRDTLMSSLLCFSDATVSTDRNRSTTPISSQENQNEKASQPIMDALTPNISLHFLYAVDLAFLMREAIGALYAPRATRRSWLEMEVAISTFNNHADNWLSRLPAEFHFTKLDTACPFARQRTSLGFHFYTTKLIISQPCLRRLAYQAPGNGSPGAVCDTMASICLQVARQMLDLLPDEADTAWLYGISPWWCILHYVMQSTTVLLVELFTWTHLGTPQAVSLTEKIQKAIRWLHTMSTKDPSSRRAWLVCMDIFSRHGSKFGFEVDDDGL